VFEVEDWMSFRTIDGLCRKAGVPEGGLAAVVVSL
jgi:hypothetical protein